MTSFIRTVAAMVAVGLGTTVFANDAPPATAAATKAAPKVARKIAIEEIGAMLEAMGFESTPFKNDKGDIVGYDVRIVSGNLAVYVSVSLSGNKENVWFSSSLGKIADPKTVSGPGLLKLLAKNGAMGMANFRYLEANGHLYMEMPLVGELLNPIRLRSCLETLASHVANTAGLWDPKALATAAAPAPVAIPEPK